MTQTQQLQPMIQLAHGQVYIRRPGCVDPLQSLVEGYADWSYCKWNYSQNLTLYYKGRCITTLSPLASGGFTDKKLEKPDLTWSVPLPERYASIADAVQWYERHMPERLKWIPQQNKEEGLDEWCIRQSFTVATLHLDIALPQQERERIERLAAFDGADIEHFVLKALYACLPDVEASYNAYYARYPEEKDAHEQK